MIKPLNYWRGWLAILAVTAVCPMAGAALRNLPGHIPAAVSHLRPNGRVAAAAPLHLAIGLPLRDQPGLDLFLKELYDPASTNFHRYLTPEQFTARFGPTEQDYQSVIDFAATNGLTVTHRHGNRVLLDVSGKAADIEKAFHVNLRTYRHPTEARDFYAPDAEPSVEARLRVLDVAGLSDYAKPVPMLHPEPVGSAAVAAAGSAPGGGYMGQDFRNAYAPGTSLNGFGQQVGLVQFSGYSPNDIFAYEAAAGLPNVPLINVLLDGSVGNVVLDPDAESEVCLDIEMAMAIATNLAAVVVFEVPYNTANVAAWNDILNAMAASNQIKQCSSSWGFSGTPSQTTEQIFQQMAAQGQSFFQASGDGDAWTSPIFVPADSTNITIVGGTTLSMNGLGGSYLGETVWNWGNIGKSWVANGSTNNFWGSGGGVSATYPIPYWQAGLNMTTNLGSTTMRNIPDVALIADNVYVVYNYGAHASFGGTSCSAPLWASFMALVNQQAAGMSKSSAGFINPAIYALGNSTNYHACFQDITTGSNTWSGSPNLYYAVPGYDLATGWGTPTGTNLINALAGGASDPLVITPLAGLVANGAVGGPFNGASQTFTLNNTTTSPVSWSLVNTSAWLTISPSSGPLAAGDQANVTVSLSPAANALAAGSYTATIVFNNLATGVAQPRMLTARVGQTLVQDGGFESGSFCHWTLAGRTEINHGAVILNGVESPHSNYNPVHTGNYGAMFADATLAVLYQALPTYPGQKYLLSCWLNNPTGGAGEQFVVNWNTNGVATNTIYSLVNPSAFAGSNYNFVVTATGTNTTLQFGGYNQPNYFGLDDISVIPIPPPSFTSVASVSNSVAFTWATLPNVPYVIQYKTNLLQASWLSLGGLITATTNALTLVDTNGFAASPQRYYRVSVAP